MQIVAFWFALFITGVPYGVTAPSVAHGAPVLLPHGSPFCGANPQNCAIPLINISHMLTPSYPVGNPSPAPPAPPLYGTLFILPLLSYMCFLVMLMKIASFSKTGLHLSVQFTSSWNIFVW